MFSSFFFLNWEKKYLLLLFIMQYLSIDGRITANIIDIS